jgi:hypothetical protein
MKMSETNRNDDPQHAVVMCEHCKKRGKPWYGSDAKCAFTEEGFEQNWNCATVNMIRDICYEGQELKYGITYQYCDDDKYATIKVDHIDIDGSPLALWVSWYKSRGNTQAMWLLFDKLPPRIPTESECLAIVAAYT